MPGKPVMKATPFVGQCDTLTHKRGVSMPKDMPEKRFTENSGKRKAELLIRPIGPTSADISGTGGRRGKAPGI